MEPEFQALAHRAEVAGRNVDDVSAVLLSLSRNHIKGIIADRSTASNIGVAKQIITAM